MIYTTLFYVIPKKLDHERNKICYKWEYEPDTYEIDNLDKKEENKRLNISNWCPTCYMWKNGLSTFYPVVGFNKYVYDENEPVRESRYNIRNMGIGNRFTKYIELWNINRNYYEIRESDLEYVKREIERLGEPKRISDIKAKEETDKIIAFLNKWLHSGCFTIVYETFFDLV